MTAEANVMRMASSTMSEASMNTWLAASAAPRPTTAMPPQVMPLASSSQMNMRRHVSDVAPRLRGSARKLRQAAIMKNLTQMTVASQADACTTGAQNIEASEKMTASSGRVTRADSSLRAIHGEQFVLEFRLDARSLRQARAHLAQLRLGDGAGILGARAMPAADSVSAAASAVRSRPVAGSAIGCHLATLGLGPERPRVRLMKRQIPKF